MIDRCIAAAGDNAENRLRCQVEHVDGTQNALHRAERLAWLRKEPEQGVCNILTNARCLTEGVDVPALDAILFLHPRKSDIDVVQAVGRVMRQAEWQEVRLYHPAHRAGPRRHGAGNGRQQRLQGRLAGHQCHQRPRRPLRGQNQPVGLDRWSRGADHRTVKGRTSAADGGSDPADSEE